MSKIIDSVTELITPIAEQCGLEIVEVEYKKIAEDMNLTVYIDKEGGVTLNDCEALHRLIDPALDELDPTNGSGYILNVSSPGLDRPLKNAKDYAKNMGKDVSVSLFTKIAEGKKFVAQLTGYEPESGIVRVKIKDKEIELELKNIALIKPDIKF